MPPGIPPPAEVRELCRRFGITVRPPDTPTTLDLIQHYKQAGIQRTHKALSGPCACSRIATRKFYSDWECDVCRAIRKSMDRDARKYESTTHKHAEEYSALQLKSPGY